MTQTEALKQVFEKHHKNERHNSMAETDYWCNQYKLLAHQAIEALAQPEQEPVDYCGIHYLPEPCAQCAKEHEGYNTPPQRTWVGMTDEQKVALCKKFPDHLTFNAIEAIEAQLKQNNGFA